MVGGLRCREVKTRQGGPRRQDTAPVERQEVAGSTDDRNVSSQVVVVKPRAETGHTSSVQVTHRGGKCRFPCSFYFTMSEALKDFEKRGN